MDGLSETTQTKLAKMEKDLGDRDARVASMRDDNEQQYRQLEDLKKALRDMERDLAKEQEEAKGAARQLKKAQRDMEAAEGAAEALRRQAVEGDAAGAAQWADRVAAAEVESQELSRQLAAAQSLAESAKERAAAAEAGQAEASAKASAADTSRRAAEREAAEARAAAAAAAALAESARREQEEAVGRSEQLESESERRAKVFNNAVKQAVQRFQGQLESERDELSARCAKLAADAEAAARGGGWIRSSRVFVVQLNATQLKDVQSTYFALRVKPPP